MARAPRRSLALLLACSTGLGGCSFLVVRPPPERMADPTRPAEFCSSSSATTVVDALAAAVAALLLAGAVTRGSAPSDAYLRGGVAIAVFGVSASYGYRQAARCDELKSINARCVKGDGAACLLLDPDYQPGRSVAVPLLCATDTECGPGARCLQSACLAAPAPAPPSP